MTSEWLTRQSFLGKDSEAILSSIKVAVIGLGGGGSHVVQQLAHIGVGQFVLMDPDRIDLSNLNRLVGGTLIDVVKKRLKTAIARRIVRRVNPTAKVTIVSADWRKKAELLRDCDVIVGCVDTYATRAELEVVARRFLIPYVDIGVDVHAIGERPYIAGQVILSMPNKPCMRCIGFLTDNLLVQEAARYGQAGSRPQVVWPNGVLASLAVGAVVQLFTPWHEGRDTAIYLEYDGNKQSVVQSNLLSYAPSSCNHFSGIGDVGDPWFRLLG